MSNIKEVIINPNKPADVKFVQYDTGQKLYVKNSPDFDFTNTTEIQITNGTESAARYRFEPYREGGIVALPDTMFRNAGILKGYIFSVDPNGHTTEALISIGIRERPVYNEYISDADEEVVIPAGFKVIQNPESVTIKAYNTDGTVTEGTVNNGSDGQPGAPGERGSDGISPEASIEQTATGAIITVKDARGTTSATLENGHDGNDGISPTAKVEQTAGGAKVTITDKNGTTTANLTNGQPGQPGTRGQDGISPSINIDTITGGHRLTITDESHGTQYVDVMDGERGRQGDPGPRGNQGLPGADGVSPTAKVTQTPTGATVTVTDGDGTTTATLTNGRDGEPGVDGISPTATVEQTETGARVTITDKNGTTTANLTNGAPGLPGSQGLPGVDGYSPIATVTQTDDGAEISITDRNGTTEAVVRNGAQGLPGVNGVSPSIVVDDIPGGHRLTIYDEQHGYQRVDVLDGHTIGVPFGGQTGQVLKKISDADFDTEWADEEGGVVDYPDLTNKPSINGVTLIGNKTAEDLGLGEIVELTQDEYDALTEIDPDTAYFINDADPEALGTAAFKDYTDRVRPGDTGLVMSHVVYSAINSALSSIYTPRGNIDCADLTSSLLVDANVGNVYETNDSGTTTALFMQGAGKTINAGDNVGIIRAGADTIMFNLMGNAFDLTDYQKKDLTTAAEGQTTVEGAIGALATNKQEKTLTTPVESRTTVETALEALSSVKQPKTLTTAVEGETTVEDALGALSTNSQATQAEVNDIVNVLGAKNRAEILSLAEFAEVSGGTISGNTVTYRGVTFTFNDDKTIAVNGTTGTSAIAIRISKNLTGLTNIILSGCPSGGSASGYQLQLHDRTSGDYPIGDYDKGRLLTLDPTHIYEVMIVIRSNITVDNLTYKPMVRLASDPDNTYVPYTMTNKQITDAMPLNVGVNNKLVSSLSRIITIAESTANPDLLNTLTGGNVKFAWGAIKLQNGAPQTIDNEVYVISYAETNISQVGDTAVIAQIAIARSGSGYNSRIYKRFYCYHGGTYKWSPWDTMISASDLSYSTSEINTGKTWIDGKPIYRKVVNIGALPNAAMKNVAHGITNIDTITDYYGMVASTSKTALKIPYVATESLDYIAMYVSITNVAVKTKQDMSAYGGYAVIEYTKTTD